MNLPGYTIWIFSIIVILLAILAIYPTPATIGLMTLISSLLIIYQAFIILKDQSTEPPQ